MKKKVTIISIICVFIIAGAVLVLTGVIDIGGNKEESVQTDSKAVCWLEYMGNAVLLDKDAQVISTSSQEPENLMKISGIDVTRLVLGEKLEVSDEESLEYGMTIAVKLAGVGIPDVGEVFIASDRTATVYLRSIKILLGDSDGLTEKLEALRKFYDKVIDLDGTLDMQEVDKNNMGYTFQKNEQTEP